MDIRDSHCLYQIKQKFGGSIKLRSGAKAARYRLHHKSGLLSLINAVNGLIRNPNRMVQLEKICNAYDIIFIYPKPLNFSNGWMAGFFDARGLIDYKFEGNNKPQLFISVTHNMYTNVAHFKEFFEGYIFVDKARSNCYTWRLESDDQLFSFLQYIKRFPLRSAIRKRSFLIPEFYGVVDLKAYKAYKGTVLNKAWIGFNNKFYRSIHTSRITSFVITNRDSNNLVVWGSKGVQGVYYGRITKTVSEMYQFNNYQYSVIIGLLLSDAWIIYASKGSKNPRLGFKQSLAKFGYFWSVFTILSPFCNSLPSLIIGQRNLT